MINERKADEACQMPCPRCRTRRLGSKGHAMVEFALVAPLFFFMVFAVFDFARLFLMEMDVQNAVLEAGRFASTGNHLPNPSKPGQNLSRVNSIIAAVQHAATDANITNTQISSLQGGSGSAGGPGDTVTVSVTTPGTDDPIRCTVFCQRGVHLHIERQFQK
jgi:Flp pilus assembly protein TadG